MTNFLLTNGRRYALIPPFYVLKKALLLCAALFLFSNLYSIDNQNDIPPVLYLTDVFGNEVEATNTFVLPEGDCTNPLSMSFSLLVVDDCDGVISNEDDVWIEVESLPTSVNPATAISIEHTNNGFYTLSADLRYGTTNVTIYAKDRDGNIASQMISFIVERESEVEISIVMDELILISDCEDTRTIYATIYLERECVYQNSELESHNIEFSFNGMVESVLHLGTYMEVTVEVGIEDDLSLWTATYRNYNDEIVATTEQTVHVSAVSGNPNPIITANDDNLYIPYCADDVLYCYFFFIYDFCNPIDADELSFDSGTSGLAINYTHIDQTTNIGFFEACGDLVPGVYFFTIEYGGEIVHPFINVGQYNNQAATITQQSVLDYTIPVCASSITTTFSIVLSDDCDIINPDNLQASLGGEVLTPTFWEYGYFEFDVTLTADNDFDLLTYQYTDSEGLATAVNDLITVTDQQDGWAPIIFHPLANINEEIFFCDGVLEEICFDIIAVDNCGGELIPTITINGVVQDLVQIHSQGNTYCLTFPQGIYTISIEAVDAAGNMSSEIFIITTTEIDVPVPDLDCLASTEVSIPMFCDTELTASDVLTGEMGCLTDEDFMVVVLDNDTSNGAIIDGTGIFDYTIEVNEGVEAGGFFACAGMLLVENDINVIINCPAGDSLSFITTSADCTADFQIPAPEILNDCVSYTIQANVYAYVWMWDWGGEAYLGGELLASNLAVGEIATGILLGGYGGYIQYRITVNGETTYSECPFSVEDQSLPVASCDTDLQVSIGGSGMTRVYVEDLDEGSAMNSCGEHRFETRRTDGEWGEYADFTCEDVQSTLTLELRVWKDTNGNGIYGFWHGNGTDNNGVILNDPADYNDVCSFEIVVDDKINPHCDSSVGPNTSCFAVDALGVDWNNAVQVSEIFGDGVVGDNCHAVAQQLEVMLNLSDCGWGTVVRTFQAVDDWGRISLSTCEQVITIFEEDLSVNVLDYDSFCTLDETCESPVNITFEVTSFCPDDMLTLEGLIDLNSDGIYENIPLSITLLDDTGEVPTYTITANIPIGTHLFNVTITNACGNNLSLDIPFEVVDCIAPVPDCISGLTVTLMPIPDGCCEAPVLAIDFIDGSIIDCTSPIIYSVHRLTAVDSGDEIPHQSQTEIILDCNDTPTMQLYIYAWDSANNPYAVQPDGSVGGANYGFCSTYVLLQTSSNACISEPGAYIKGVILTENNEGIENVSIDLSGNIFQNTFTGNDGHYEFEDLSYEFNYTITPHLNEMSENAISTFDIILISKHILGQQLLDSPYKIIAADVNASETVTTADLIQIRRVLLGIYDEFPTNTFWRFVDADYNFPNAANPWAEPFPEVRNIANLDDNELDENFIGVAIGDVNNSVIPNVADNFDERNATNTLTLLTSEKVLKKGNTYRIPFTKKGLENIIGYQFTLAFDQNVLDFQTIEYGLAQANNFGMDYVDEDLITTSWDTFTGKVAENDELFTLLFYAKSDANLSEVLSINSRITKAEAYDESGIADLKLDFTPSEATKNEFALYQNQPNPFAVKTEIGFSLPKDELVHLIIQDVRGKTLQTSKIAGKKGYNSIVIDARTLGNQGILFYTISTTTFTATKRMILVE